MLALLAPLASLLGIETEALIQRFRRQALAWSVVGIFLAVGVIFLLVAANAALAQNFGPVIAPLMLAGAALLIALIVYLVSFVTTSIAARAEAERRHGAETTALVTSAAIAAVPMLFRSPLLKKIGLPVGGALAAAYLLSRSNRHTDSN